MAIRLETKDAFNKAKSKYKFRHKLSSWNWFKSDTCYIPEDDCFISLDKAIKKGLLITY